MQVLGSDTSVAAEVLLVVTPSVLPGELLVFVAIISDRLITTTDNMTVIIDNTARIYSQYDISSLKQDVVFFFTLT